jgi:hypothetical protein
MSVTLYYLKLLCFFGLHTEASLSTPTLEAFKTTSRLTAANHVCITQRNISANDIDSLQKTFDHHEFYLWALESMAIDRQAIARLRFHHHTSYPLMTIDLKNLVPLPSIFSTLAIEKINSRTDILERWVPLVIQSYNVLPNQINDYKDFILYLMTTPYFEKMQFYIGSYDNHDVSACFTINNDGIITLHKVATIPQYRNKGIGTFLSLYALHDNSLHAHTALLLASAMGRPIYEKIGFKTIDVADLYVAADPQG